MPHEALVASMQDHQKFFPVNAGPDSVAVSNRFIVISNIESTQPDEVREGFERVVRPRLADARFFLEQDQLHPLEHYLSALNAVVFQQKIGSIGDKSKRMAAISKNIASKLSFNEAICERAARLSKCDLVSQMVGEFPELQGTMGHYYALHGGEPAELAEAIAEHYQPRFAGDAIPASPAGQIVGLADRCDSVVGIFAAGLRPTGNKDPFALRRSALGLIRILLEAELDLPLDRLLALAANQLTEQGMTVEPAVLADVREFITERARSHFRETGFETEVVSAALSSDWDSFPDLHARLNALNEFLDNDSGRSLAAANKRIGNILKKSKTEEVGKIDENKLVLDEEKHLFDEVVKLDQAMKPLLSNSDYAACLTLLSPLQAVVDGYFDAVMVMDEDLVLRRNRLALLARLKGLFDQVADLSVLGA